jgi:hypothetical protein
VTDTLEPGQTFASGSCTFVNCSSAGTSLTFYDGNLAPGGSATNYFSVWVNNVPTTAVIANTAFATASNASTVQSNTTSVTVNGYPVAFPYQYYFPPYYTAPAPIASGVLGAFTVCGTISAYTPAGAAAGSITINGETYPLMPGLIAGGVPVVVGTNQCIVFQANGVGSIAAMTVGANIPGTNYVCGAISQFSPGYQLYPGFYPYAGYNPNPGYAPYPGYGPYPAGAPYGTGYYGYGGPIVIGGYPYPMAPGTVFPFLPQYGNPYCFLTNPTGQVAGSLSVVPTAAFPADTESGKIYNKMHRKMQ